MIQEWIIGHAVKIALFAIIAAGIAGAIGMWHHQIYVEGREAGRAEVTAEWQKEKKQRAADDAAARQEEQRRSDAIQKQFTDSEKSYREQLDQMRRARDAAGGLRVPAACGGADGAAGRDHGAAAGTIRIPSEIERDFYALASDAGEVVRQARACQQWAAGVVEKQQSDNGLLTEAEK